MSDYTVTNALAFILAVNVLFFLGQVATDNINPAGPIFFNKNNSMLGEYDTTGNYTLDENPFDELPTTETAVSPDADGTGGGFFTDVWQSVTGWFTDTEIGRGVSYIKNIVNALPHFLSVIGTPAEIVFAIGFFWHALTVFLIIIFLKGGK